LSFRHIKWVEFLQDYTFILKHRAWIDNKAVDALSYFITILHSIKNFVVGFEHLKDEYPQCPDFGIILRNP